MRKLFLVSAITVMIASQAIAAPVTGKAAKKMLFSPRGSVFTVVPQGFMTQTDVATLEQLSKLEQFRAVLYYGAIAASPKHGLGHKSIAATSNHHSLTAAGAQALKECNTLRRGGPKCVIVAHITPKKYANRPLTMSVSATTALRRTYLKGRGAKAMAISPITGEYAIAKGSGAANAALVACNKAARVKGAADCQIVVQDK